MPSLVIKKLPEELHRSLKEQAARNHRSMTREAILILEEAVIGRRPEKSLPAPVRLKFQADNDWISRAKRQGRE